MGVTLATARQEVSRRAQEFLQGTATGGSASTVVAANDLFHADGYWDDTWVLFTSGTNNDVLRRVQTFTQSTSTLNLYSSAPASVASGDTFDLYRRFNPMTDIKNAINIAINVGAPDFREKHRDVATATMNQLQYGFPTMLMDKGLVAVEYQWYVGANQGDWPFQKISPDLYEVIESWDAVNNRQSKTLQLKFNPETNKLLRFVFDSPLGTVSTSTDTIHLDLPELEWLYTQSAAEVWRMEASRTSDVTRDSALKELGRWEIRSDKLRASLAPEQPQRPLRRSTFRTIPGRATGWW